MMVGGDLTMIMIKLDACGILFFSSGVERDRFVTTGKSNTRPYVLDCSRRGMALASGLSITWDGCNG